MSPVERYTQTLRYLAAMPFLDRLELAAVSDTPDRTVHDTVARLEERGLVSSVRHSTDLIPSTRRLYPTGAGLHRLAQGDGLGMEALLQRLPVSRHWQRLLLERLDAVGVIYRVASSIALVGGSLSFRWYRRTPLDAVMGLEDGRTIGVLRQGTTSDRTGFSKRVWRLLEGPLPDALLVLFPDEMRLRHARGLLRRSTVQVWLALERDAAQVNTMEAIWRLPSFNNTQDLRDVLSQVEPGGPPPAGEPPLAGPLLPWSIPVMDGGLDLPGYLMPAVLKPAEKRALDTLFDWPWVTSQDLAGLLGISRARTSQLTVPLVSAGLACRTGLGGLERWALTDESLALLARRDRTAVGRLREQWSGELKDAKAPVTWRNIYGTRSRLLARNLEHTSAVHRFLGDMSRQAKAQGYRVAHRPTGRCATSSTTTSNAPSTPTPSASYGTTRRQYPSSWNGSGGRCDPGPWRPGWLLTCVTIPPSSLWTTTGYRPWCL